MDALTPPPLDAHAVAQRSDAWRDSFRPKGVAQEWLFSQVVVSSLRIDRCQAEESNLRGYLARRAAVSWDDDRRLDAEALGEGLARRPARNRLRLGRTRQGCEWLI